MVMYLNAEEVYRQANTNNVRLKSITRVTIVDLLFIQTKLFVKNPEKCFVENHNLERTLKPITDCDF